MLEKNKADVLIIGGGPAGLYASFYAGLRDLSVILFEAQPELGGKLNFYPEKYVWDIGALAPTKGYEVKQNLINQAKMFDSQLKTQTKIQQIEREKVGFKVIDDYGKTYYGRTILFAVGGGIVSPKRLEAAYDEAVAPQIHYTFPAYDLLKGKRVIVSGGGNAAVDYALESLKIAEEVSLCYRGDKLSAHEGQIKQLAAAGIPVHLNTTIQAIQSAETGMRVLLQKKSHSSTYEINADQLIVQHGHDRDCTFLDELPFDFTRVDDFYLDCQQPTATNIEGMYAAGDIQFCEGKVNLLLGAFQDAACAINQVKQYLDPESFKQAMVSSHNDKFSELNQQLEQQ